MEILGYQISYGNGRLRYGLGKKAWKNLEEGLGEAHEATNPGEMAKAVIRGWLASYGPAFEDVEESVVLDRVRRTAAQNGFRELGTEEDSPGMAPGSTPEMVCGRSHALGDLSVPSVFPATRCRASGTYRLPLGRRGWLPRGLSPGQSAPFYSREAVRRQRTSGSRVANGLLSSGVCWHGRCHWSGHCRCGRWCLPRGHWTPWRSSVCC